MLLSKLKAKLPDWAWAGLTTAVFTFVGLFGASLAGWVQSVVSWVNSGGVDVFPDVTVLGKALVAAAGSALTGGINAVYRWAQGKFSFVPGNGPTYGA